ncbi:MAG: hypothetical protein AAF412_04065 [Pseudomonadota bacterium]
MMAEGKFTRETVDMTEQQRKAQRARNIAIAVSLIAFVVVLYVATWMKLGANILARDL